MNILVTGAAGFIGSHVCEHFIEKGNTIIGIDNFDNFYRKEIKEKNLSFLLSQPSFHFFEADIRNTTDLQKIFSDFKIELVIHLAAKAGVRPSMDSAKEYYDVNVNGTLNLLEVMRMNGVKNMLFASSSSVYGNNVKVPFSEADNVDNPISPYAATKKSGELLCHVYTHLYGFNITCLRFFTVFGPRQRPDLAIHKFTKLILEGKSIPVYGDGSTSRDYTYIRDIVDGISCASENLENYKIYNLGESRVISLTRLITFLEESIGKKAIIESLPLQPGDVSITYADISKARSEIGYNPQYSMSDGIESFVKWYNSNN